MNESPQQTPWLSERAAAIFMVGWLLFVLLADLLTLHWFPTPWIDEVMFADPAISLIREGHWSSTAWYGRGDLTYWTGNSPLYSAFLYLWLLIAGPDSAGVRAFNCVLAALIFTLAWVAIKRLRFVPCPLTRFAVLAALSWCYPISYSVRCGRPDLIGMLILVLAALAWSIPHPKLARGGLVLAMVCLPFASLHYLFYMPVILGLLFWQALPENRAKIGAILVGGFIGGLLFFSYHQWFAGWDGLLANIQDIRARRDTAPLANAMQLLKTVVFRFYLGRPHFLLLFTLTGLFWCLWRRLIPAARRSLITATIFLTVPGFIVGFGAHFGVPYHWLAVAPGALFLAKCAAESWSTLGLPSRALCVGIACAVALTGRPVFVGMGGFLNIASYTRSIEAAAIQVTRPSDVAYGDWQLYYALKPRIRRIYFPYIIPRLEKDEKDAVTIAFLPSTQPANPAWLAETFGGEWSEVAVLPAPRTLPIPGTWANGFSPSFFFGARLSVYRRTNANGASQLAAQ